MLPRSGSVGKKEALLGTNTPTPLPLASGIFALFPPFVPRRQLDQKRLC